ncbi:uncharacterized protein N7477_000625 [Penicillium maclennaniae]|uniref:uncharacterized protein n=1 Tax=Penicillium maclennaniae TaxID=1343394 RepID=UPI00254224A5|nr:uncharacterized protein N7477_000625 [Penicillium maclennaniae]KAJ5684280.1 hypothetical protein N7477_000625 [Penicillium maclennaniae]
MIVREPSRKSDLVAEVQSHGGEWHSLDLNNSNAAKALINFVESTGQAIDVLIKNAESIIFGAIEQLADEELHNQMETLYFGPSRLIHALIPRMRKRRFGFGVDISSGAALDAREIMGGYATGNLALDDTLPEDYRGSVAELTMDAIKSGKLPFDGDQDKASKAIFEVAAGEGIGAGREAERFLPLGS